MNRELRGRERGEWQSDPGTTPEQPSLQDSLVEDELETNRPFVVNTVPVLDIQPNRENP